MVCLHARQELPIQVLSSTHGLYYKPVTIINDDSRIVNWLETSHTDNARVVIYNRLMFIVQATECGTSPKYKLLHFLTAIISKTKRNLSAFNRDACCHLALCLWLIIFHNSKGSLITLFRKKNTSAYLSIAKWNNTFERCKQFSEYQNYLVLRDIWWSKF